MYMPASQGKGQPLTVLVLNNGTLALPFKEQDAFHATRKGFEVVLGHKN